MPDKYVTLIAPTAIGIARRRIPPHIATDATRALGNHWLISMFLIAVLFPPEANFVVGDLVLSPQRLLLLISVVPCLWLLLSRRLGGIYASDGLMLFHTLWAFLSFAENHGIDRAIKSGGIYSVEVLGSYLLGRLLIHDVQSFQFLIRRYALAMGVLILVTVPEAITGRNVLREGLATLMGSAAFEPSDKRMGLFRACGTFQHPIIYGIWTATSLGMVWYTLPTVDRTHLRKLPYRTLIVCGTMVSVSSGAIYTLVVQLLLIAWDRVTKGVSCRWAWLGVVIGVNYVTIDILSNRDPITAIVTRLTFNPETAYARQVIWDFASQEVVRSPTFGIGFNDWTRPDWMHNASIDNFWLVIAVRHGLPGSMSLMGALLYLFLQLARARPCNVQEERIRSGWMISMLGLAIAASTVHLWGSALTSFCFLLGSAVWLVQGARYRRNMV